MKSVSSNQSEEGACDPLPLLQELVEQARIQTKHLSEIQVGIELDACLLDKIGRIVCMTANETHKNTQLLTTIRDGLNSLLEMAAQEAVIPGNMAEMGVTQSSTLSPPKDAYCEP